MMGKRQPVRKHFTIQEPVYVLAVHLLLNYDEDEQIKWLHDTLHFDVDDAYIDRSAECCASTEVFNFPDGSEQYVVSIRDTQHPDILSIVVHETFHLVSRIFKRKSIEFDYLNHEAWAYYQEYWFRRIWEKINAKV
jgi:hypothetical protein